MAKYKIVIEFETERDMKFPVDAELLVAMQAQLESLDDGDFSKPNPTKCGDSKVIKVK